jgi:hypothetical protein
MRRCLSSFLVIIILIAVICAGKGIPNYDVSSTGTQLSPKALTSATLYLSPPKANGIKGQTVVVNANVVDIVHLFAFQIGLRFDPEVVECLNVTEGGFLSGNGADFVLFWPGTINNTAGVITAYGWTLVNITEVKSGSGVLATFSFRVKTTGYSNLHIYSFIAMDDSPAQIPCKIVDVYTPIREWSECSISIVGNAQGQDSEYSAHNVTNAPPFPEYHLFSFNVTGFPIEDDTFAFCNVSIPKCLLWANYSGLPYGGWGVLLNERVHNIAAMYENATHTSLYFEFNYNASNPTTNVKIVTAIDLEHPYPNAKLLVSMDKWWYSYGEHVTVKVRFTIDDQAIGNGTILLKIAFQNLSIYLSALNKTDTNGNATFTFPINQNLPFGNYTIHLMAGKLGLPGACVTKYFWIWRRPLIEPFPWQYAKYRYHMYDTNGSLYEYGWWNTTYTSYVAPNLVNCSLNLFIISRFVNFSTNDWACINTTTRWVPQGTTMVNTFYELWIQTNATIGSHIAIANTTTTVTGSKAVLLRMTDGTIGFVDCWTVRYMASSSTVNTLFFDKKTGLCVYAEIIMMTKSGNFTGYLGLTDTNIPIAYNFGDINHDGTVNNTDATLMQGAWQTKIGDANYDPDIDFNKDGIINIKDAAIIGINWQRRREVTKFFSQSFMR